jgi:hypothetical protein
MHGKLCLIGVFDIIFSPNVPVRHPRIAIGFNLTGEPGESGPVKLEIIGPTGQVVARAEAQFALPDTGSAQANLELPGLVLPEFGRYAVQVDTGEGVPKVAWITLKQAAIPS